MSPSLRKMGGAGITGLRLRAPAKVNLYLRVIGRRADGLHLLRSLVVFADVGDALHLSPAREISLRVTGRYADAVPGDGGNLALQAAQLLQRLTGTTAGADMMLEKHLPPAAGLGGGSADAAAVLKGLTRLWNLPDDARLPQWGAMLGADLPVCLYGRAVFVSGVGEGLTPADHAPPLPALLVNPGKPLSTAAVFKRFAVTADANSCQMTAPASSAARHQSDFMRMLQDRPNQLTAAAVSLVPEISDVLQAIDRTPGCLLARMSGSGASCFGLYETMAEAQLAAERITTAQPEWWARATLLNGAAD